MQSGVAKGLKVPCLFMITEVRYAVKKIPEVGIRCIPAYTPPIHHCLFRLTGAYVNRTVDWQRTEHFRNPHPTPAGVG